MKFEQPPVGSGVKPEKQENASSKWRSVAKTAAISMALMFGGKEAMAGSEVEVPQPDGTKAVEKVDAKEIEKARAYSLLDTLRTLPNPEGASEAQAKLMKERAGIILVNRFALERSGATSGTVSPEALKGALDELGSHAGEYGRDRLGAEDEIEGMNAFNSDPNFGFLRGMAVDNANAVEGAHSVEQNPEPEWNSPLPRIVSDEPPVRLPYPPQERK